MTIRVALPARVSTSDRDQNPETQLMPLREFVEVLATSKSGTLLLRRDQGEMAVL